MYCCNKILPTRYPIHNYVVELIKCTIDAKPRELTENIVEFARLSLTIFGFNI